MLNAKAYYINNETYVKTESELSEKFHVNIRHGCCLSPILFNVDGEYIVNKVI